MQAGPGRPKGARNLVTRAAKQTLEQAFEKRGGLKQFMKWADTHESDFYALWGKLIPRAMDVTNREADDLPTRAEVKERVLKLLKDA